MDDAREMLAHAVALRGRQNMAEALSAIEHAARLAPNDPDIALTRAQLAYEAGQPAADLFAMAARLAPNQVDIQRSLALALVAEGQDDRGEALLASLIEDNPGWLDGHRTLCGIRTTAGQEDFARSLAQATRTDPANQALWLAWFHILSIARDWAGAKRVLDAAETALGERPSLRIGRIFIASESGEAADDAHLFDPVEGVADPGLDMARVRHFLRGGQVPRAEAIAAAHMGTPSVRPFWPYLSLAWRLLDDPRAQWLDRAMTFVKPHDLDFSPDELDQLTSAIRALHTMKAPYHEQSVRGGTQTSRPLLLQLDPAIRMARDKIEQAVRAYIDQLPEPDPAHPLLSPARAAFAFSGSWSVRLRAQGFHAAHTHPAGWISSALYVDVPERASLGTPPAGHLQFGKGPPELDLPIDPYGDVAPRPGRLLLFPSTMWHATVPFDRGERISIAFDIVPAG